MDRIKKDVSHTSPSPPKVGDKRPIKVVSAALFGSVIGGILAVAMLKAVRPLSRIVSSKEAQTGLILGVAGLSGGASGFVSLRVTRPRPSEKSSSSSAHAIHTAGNSPPQDDSLVHPTTGFSAPPSLGIDVAELSRQSEELLEHFRAADFSDTEVMAEAASALVKLYGDWVRSVGQEGAGEWLNGEEGPVHYLLERIEMATPITHVGISTQRQPVKRKAVAVRDAIHNTLFWIKERPASSMQIKRVMANYQGLVDALGNELTVLIVGNTAPLLHLERAEVRASVIGAKEITVSDYVDPELIFQQRLQLKSSQAASESLQSCFDTVLTEGGVFLDLKDKAVADYGILLRNLCDEAAVDRHIQELLQAAYFDVYEDGKTRPAYAALKETIKERSPVRLFVRDNRPCLELDEEVCALIQCAYQGQNDAIAPSVVESNSGESVRAKYFGDLQRAEGEEQVTTIASPFSSVLWNIQNDPFVQVLKNYKIETSESRYRLDPGHFEEIKTAAEQAEQQLRRELNEAFSDAKWQAPARYKQPLEKMRDKLCHSWQEMKQLVTLEEGQTWDDERKARYDRVYKEAHAQVTNLKMVMELTEEYIGIDEAFCRRLTMLFCGIAGGRDREALRLIGEELRTFLMDRDSALKSSIGNGQEGVMPVLLTSFRKRLEAFSIRHDQLQLRTDLRHQSRQEDWIPVAWGISTLAAQKGTVAANDSLSGHHFLNYIQTDTNVFCRLDNSSQSNRDTDRRVHVYEPQRGLQRNDVKLFGSEAALFVHRDVAEQVRQALENASSWSTPKWKDNNCFISSAVVLLTAFWVAGNALDPERFEMPEEVEGQEEPKAGEANEAVHGS